MLLFFVYILYFVKRNDHFLELRYISAVIIIIIIIGIVTFLKNMPFWNVS